MLGKALALALAGLVAAAVPLRADEPAWPTGRLERRAAERGPIRSQLEAALAVPVAEVTAQAVAAARRQAAGPSSSQGRSSGVPGFVWVLIGLASLLALWAEWARGWSKI